jgi:DeoR family transcriptional regulator of aga operon
MPTITAGESSFEANVSHEAVAKRAIGRVAAGFVASGNSVLLDVGSTALAVANALVDRHDLTDVLVITNGLTIALALEAAMPRFTVVVTGGTLRPLQHSLVGPFAMLDVVMTDIAFIGCNGVDVAHGVTNINLPEAEVKRRMVAATKRAVVVADGSKLGMASLGRIGALDEFDSLVTTGDASSLRGSPMKVVIAT